MKEAVVDKEAHGHPNRICFLMETFNLPVFPILTFYQVCAGFPSEK